MRTLVLMLLLGLALAAGACGGDDADAGGAEDGAAAQARPDPAQQTDAATVAVSGQESHLRIGDEMGRALEREGVSVTALEPATRDGDTFALPITGGRVEVEALQGTLDHAGGIGLTGDSEQSSLALRDLFLDLRAGWGYPLVGGTRVQFFTFDTDAVKVERAEGDVVTGQVPVRLTNDAALVLNETFGSSFEPGQEFGELSVRADPRAGAERAAGDTVDELRELEQRARALADEAREELSAEDRRRLERAARSLDEALRP